MYDLNLPNERELKRLIKNRLRRTNLTVTKVCTFAGLDPANILQWMKSSNRSITYSTLYIFIQALKELS